MSSLKPPLEIHPVTSSRWKDFETLFGKNGACDGCWCMWWRLKRSDYSQQRGEGNRSAIKKIIRRNGIPGLLAYADKQPVGWVSVGRRDIFPVLDRSKNLKRVDDQAVWSIVCLFVARRFRHKRITSALIKAAIEHAAEQGAKLVEAYPVDRKEEKVRDSYLYTGLPSTFQKLGFKEVMRRSPARPILRYQIR